MSKTLFIQLSRLGDCLQSTPLLASWRERHPEDRIEVLTHTAYAPVFEENPSVDEVVAYSPPLDILRDETKAPWEKLRAVEMWLSSLQARKYDCVVNLTHDPLSCWVVAALRPRQALGLSIDATGQTRTRDPWSLYLLSVLKYRSQNLLNLVDTYAHLSGGPAVTESLRFTVTEPSRKEINSWLPVSVGLIVGFQPGANKAERQWPAENFVRLGRYLSENYGAQIVIFGTQAEEPLAAQIARGIPGSINFAGRTSIPQLAALLERCKYLVTNDTGTMHLAAAVGTYVVALFEASAYLRETGPYGAGHWIVQSRQVHEYGERTTEELKNMKRIPVEEVMRALDTLLSTAAVPAHLLEGTAAAADHFRSDFLDGHLDFRPAYSRPLDAVTLCSYLQKPVWLAALDAKDLDAAAAVATIPESLEKHFFFSEAVDWIESIKEFQQSIRDLRLPLGRLKDLLNRNLSKLGRNRNYRVPEIDITQLSELEQKILMFQSHPATRPFIAYFETALALVGGDTTHNYLLSYLQPVLLLAKQADLFLAMLAEAQTILARKTFVPAAANVPFSC